MGKEKIKLRRDPSEVPSYEEMEGILETESQREIPLEKQGKHFVSIEPLIEFLNFLGFDTSDFSLNRNWQEVLKEREKLHTLVELVLSKNQDEIADEARKLYRYLAEEDSPAKSDLIFVFGSRSENRPKKAVELFNKGLAPKIMFSGGHAYWQETDEKEADNFRRIAMELGVPQEAIITESSSITLPDNVRTSLNYLDEIGFSYKKMVLVNSPFAQRRGYACMKKYSPVGTKFFRVNSLVSEGLREGDWFTNESGIKYIFNEFGKIWMGLV